MGVMGGKKEWLKRFSHLECLSFFVCFVCPDLNVEVSEVSNSLMPIASH